MVAGKNGGKISKEELLEAKKVEAGLQNTVFHMPFKVLEFEMMTVNKDGFTILEASKDENFTQKHLSTINNLVPGESIYFKGIKAEGPDGFVRNLETLSFTLIP